jgi:antitoxin component YwqK of YwqJK toxin-antitoxin module
MFRIIFAINIFLITACNQPDVRQVAPGSLKAELNISDYSIEDFGDGLQRARKFDDDDNLLEEGLLLNGERNGSWTIFQSNGKPHIVNSYVNGRKNGLTMEYDKNGRVLKEANFINDQFDGSYKEFRMYIPFRDSNFKNGKYDGMHKEFDQQGNLQKEMEFKNGVQHGVMNYYNLEGEITVTYQFENGKKVEGGGIVE